MGDWISFTARKKFVRRIPVSFRAKGKRVTFKARKKFVRRVRVKFKRSGFY